MADKKIIAVLGATGAQGGGLVRAILNDAGGGFSARAITRNANSPKALSLIGSWAAFRLSMRLAAPTRQGPHD